MPQKIFHGIRFQEFWGRIPGKKHEWVHVKTKPSAITAKREQRRNKLMTRKQVFLFSLLVYIQDSFQATRAKVWRQEMGTKIERNRLLK